MSGRGSEGSKSQFTQVEQPKPPNHVRHVCNPIHRIPLLPPRHVTPPCIINVSVLCFFYVWFLSQGLNLVIHSENKSLPLFRVFVSLSRNPQSIESCTLVGQCARSSLLHVGVPALARRPWQRKLLRTECRWR